MIRAAFALFLLMIPAAAQQYWHRVSGSFGALTPKAGWQTGPFKNAPAVAFDYGFRFHRHGQFDAGVDAAFGKYQEGGRAGIVTERNRMIYIPRVGYRLIAPLWQDRIEAHLGFGGAHSFFKSPLRGSETWLVYGQIGANYAIDPNRKYRAGFTTRWLRDPIGSPVQQWVAFMGEISYSFGE